MYHNQYTKLFFIFPPFDSPSHQRAVIFLCQVDFLLHENKTSGDDARIALFLSAAFGILPPSATVPLPLEGKAGGREASQGMLPRLLLEEKLSQSD